MVMSVWGFSTQREKDCINNTNRTLKALLVLLVVLVKESQTLLKEGSILADFDFTSDASRSLNILLSTLNQTIRFVTTQRGEN